MAAADTTTRRPGRAEWALAACSALAVLGAAGLAEAVLRAASPAFLAGTRARHPHVYSETYGWALRPGARYTGRGGEAITVNERGYRGPLHAGRPAAGVRRVVMLGDSVTFGSGVSDAETFAALLDARPDLEVINLGVDGYGTDQALLRLEGEGLAAAPDVVLLNFCVRNDYFDNALPVALYDGRSPKPYFTVSPAGLVLHDAHLKLTGAQRAAVALMEQSVARERARCTGSGADRRRWGRAATRRTGASAATPSSPTSSAPPTSRAGSSSAPRSGARAPAPPSSSSCIPTVARGRETRAW